MKLTIRLSSTNVKVVNVKPNDPLYILLNLLNITDKKTVFICNGIAHCMGSIETFEEINLPDEAKIFVSNQGLATFLILK